MGRLHFSASLWLIVDGGAVSIAALQRLPAMGKLSQRVKRIASGWGFLPAVAYSALPSAAAEHRLNRPAA